MSENKPCDFVRIHPTVGRVVWFWPSKLTGSSGFTHYPDQPCAATVAYVHNDHIVNLSVTDHKGAQHSMTSVQLIQAGELASEYGYYCEWMPFQVGQAKAQLAK